MYPKEKLVTQSDKVLHNPDRQTFRDLIALMPNAQMTEFDNFNVATRVTARSKASTYVATDHPEEYSDQCITTAEYQRVAELQDAYIADREMVVVDGFIGNDPEFRTAARLIIESANANIAAMQQALYFPLQAHEVADFEPELCVVYTPNLKVEGYPNDRLIAVDLAQGVTRVFNSDYFGESKKGGLRMWNKLVYDRGGLSLHAGCKIIPVDGVNKTALIVGLSGTGKTTTTFTKQNNSKPVQDDFVALMPDGRVYATENGCFAKTFALDAAQEPTIHKAVCHTDAYLENVAQDGSHIDFFDTSYTQNGRAVFTMSQVEGAGDAGEIKKADFLLILNKNEGIIPAVAKLTPAQAAAFFMLGETKGTSAGGKEEAGKFLRVPGTNPFFPLHHSKQGNRMQELLKATGMDVYLMNTGSVGGSVEAGGKKVGIAHSSAVVKALAEGTIEWVECDDFGYQLAAKVPGFPEQDSELLQPKEKYEADGKSAEYRELVSQLKGDRVEFLNGWDGLNEDLIRAVS